ncbi:MAG: sugar phosphate isomerase/epimerase [Firmicutes bacterium]|nr:sugar phosphate isomerase/epimerase [Bacillota bacterium]
MEISRLAISAITTQRWSAWEDLKQYQAVGIRAMGLWRFKLDGVDLVQYRRALSDAGITVTNLCFGGQFTLGVEEALEDGRRALDQAAQLAAPVLLVISGPVRETLEQSHGLLMEGLGRLAEEATKYQITLALEALHPMDMTQWTIIPTVNNALDVLDGLNHPALGLMLDLYNSWWDPALPQAIQRAGPRIRSVQFADWRAPTRSFTDRALPGTGVANLSQLIHGIEATGYGGAYDLEIFSDELWSNPDGYPALLTHTIQWWRGV